MPLHRQRTVLAFLLPVAWGLAAGWWTPRGPGTVGTALASIGISLAAGLLAGWLSRSRWAMLAAPMLFAVSVEMVRIGLRGPTVDRPHLSGFGLVALLAGRGVHGLLALLPLLVGAAYGAGIARWVGGVVPRGPVLRWLGRGGVGLLAAVLALVTVGAAVPARTVSIPGGIARFDSVPSAGRQLGLLIRGTDPTAPVLLVVPGPPGGSEIASVRRHLAALERHFVVVAWDRAAGPRSWSAFRSPGWTLEDEVADLLAVTRHLRKRFGRDRIHLLAHSGGTIPGLLAVQRHPELFAAYVGVGQVVSLREADRSQYADTLAWARRTGRAGLADRMAAQGPPPYRDIWAYEPLLTNEAGAFAFDRAGAGEDETGMVGNLGVPEYSPLETAHVFGFLDGWDVLYPRLQDLDFRRDVRQLQVPAYFVDGAHEVPGRLRLFDEWYAQLQAPRKDHLVIPGAGHRSLFERPEPFVAYLARLGEGTDPPGD
ncbi:alpha/beta hydrolase [Micromonospora sp. DR5-3]|uniref:alpha/beta fold hydrolase n=1 Tax=unclassified Micromonospora TaxID=2617518 RepID=UPI0011D7E2A3|nr:MULTISPECIES: alpha/beta hydrolase [unclassified Micromonospora]MCW3813344.1 alpha/beta hydrolase [Micromonospora sp. DR5-3]TYC24728.1 alpha/beta hydrolase [Micromonospora sp. MP36]